MVWYDFGVWSNIVFFCCFSFSFDKRHLILLYSLYSKKWSWFSMKKEDFFPSKARFYSFPPCDGHTKKKKKTNLGRAARRRLLDCWSSAGAVLELVFDQLASCELVALSRFLWYYMIGRLVDLFDISDCLLYYPLDISFLFLISINFTQDFYFFLKGWLERVGIPVGMLIRVLILRPCLRQFHHEPWGGEEGSHGMTIHGSKWRNDDFKIF